MSNTNNNPQTMQCQLHIFMVSQFIQYIIKLSMTSSFISLLSISANTPIILTCSHHHNVHELLEDNGGICGRASLSHSIRKHITAPHVLATHNFPPKIKGNNLDHYLCIQDLQINVWDSPRWTMSTGRNSMIMDNWKSARKLVQGLVLCMIASAHSFYGFELKSK